MFLMYKRRIDMKKSLLWGLLVLTSLGGIDFVSARDRAVSDDVGQVSPPKRSRKLRRPATDVQQPVDKAAQASDDGDKNSDVVQPRKHPMRTRSASRSPSPDLHTRGVAAEMPLDLAPISEGDGSDVEGDDECDFGARSPLPVRPNPGLLTRQHTSPNDLDSEDSLSRSGSRSGSSSDSSSSSSSDSSSSSGSDASDEEEELDPVEAAHANLHEVIKLLEDMIDAPAGAFTDIERATIINAYNGLAAITGKPMLSEDSESDDEESTDDEDGQPAVRGALQPAEMPVADLSRGSRLMDCLRALTGNCSRRKVAVLTAAALAIGARKYGLVG